MLSKIEWTEQTVNVSSVPAGDDTISQPDIKIKMDKDYTTIHIKGKASIPFKTEWVQYLIDQLQNQLEAVK